MDDARFPGPDPGRAGLCCDYDGTLAPIVTDPGAARMPEEMRPVLADLAGRLGLLAVVSGRPAEFLGEHVRVPGMRLLGVYGMEEWVDGEVRPRSEIEPFLDAVADAKRVLERLTEVDGVTIEDKRITVAVHWRNAPDREATERSMLALVEDVAAEHGLRIEPGKFVAELRPPVDWDKGTTVKALCEAHSLRTVAYVGDDLGDLAAFAAAREAGGIAVLVESGDETPPRLADAADHALDGPDAVAGWLTALRDRLCRP